MQELAFPFEKYAYDPNIESARLLYKLDPNCIKHFMEDIAYFEESGISYLDSVPNLFKFFSLFAPLVLQAKESSSLAEVQSVNEAVKKLHQRLDELELGEFYTSAMIEISDLENDMSHKAIRLDMQNYKQYFNSPLPEKVFDFFSSVDVQGLPQSIQGTLAASEILSTEGFGNVLKRELNLVYPGSGGHLTPLVIAFDLFERNCIDSANLLFNDLRDSSEFISAALKKFESIHIISDLQIETVSDGTKTRFLCKYNDSPICIEFLQADFNEIDDWSTNGKTPNVVYDHLPYQSARPGSATNFFSTKQDSGLHGQVFHIIPTATIDIRNVAGEKQVLSTKRRQNVSFADKGSWVVSGNTGVGVTVALIEYD